MTQLNSYTEPSAETIISLFDQFIEKCENKTGNKEFFYKLLRKTRNIKNRNLISKQTILNFLHYLELNDALELENGENIYIVREKNVKEFYFKNSQLFKATERISDHFSIISI